MANVHELMGIGMPAAQAMGVAFGSKGTVAAAGTVQGDAAALGLQGLINVTGGNGTVGVILNANFPINSTQIVVNQGSGVLKIYPPSGGAINGMSANTNWVSGVNQAGIIGRSGPTEWFAVGEEA